ncbi:MAG: triose-phosphate isomerase [Alphaproteobacteria bacterium]
MSEPKPILLVANWKLNGTRARVRGFVHALAQAEWNLPRRVEVVFCPPMPYLLTAAAARAPNTRLVLGAQTCSSESEGAFTGEVSAAQISDSGAEYVIIGHSERRQRGESDAVIRGQLHQAGRAGLMPIFCIGETEAERKAGKTEAALAAQLAALEGFSGPLVVAYEPVWAIGSGLTPTVKEIAAAHAFIRMQMVKSGRDSAFRLLYGGSVKPANIQEILAISGVDGVLVGSASLDAGVFESLLDAARKLENI